MGGVGAGGGAGLYKARDTARSTQFPLDRASWRRARDGAEAPGGGGLAAGEKGAVLESWDGQCPGPIIEKVKKKKLGGGDKMRLPNESKAVGRP